MLLAADVVVRALFQATDHDVIQRVRGGVEMFSYGKPTRSVSNTTGAIIETFPESPYSLSAALLSKEMNTQHSKTDR